MENQSSEREETATGKGVLGWFIGAGILMLLYVVLGWFDNTTELVPTHENVDAVTFCVAGITGVVFCGAAIYLSKRWTLWRRIGFALAFLLLGTLIVLISQLSNQQNSTMSTLTWSHATNSRIVRLLLCVVFA